MNPPKALPCRLAELLTEWKAQADIFRGQGIDVAPVQLLGPVSVTEEIRFNQIHNGSDLDESDELRVRVPSLAPGWHVVPPASITVGNPLVRGAVRRQEILRLLAKHGPWGGAVALPDGRVISSADYASCCRQLGLSLHLRVIPAELEAVARAYLSASYGVYSYAHLPRTTWAQALAQMNRLNGGGKRELRSRTYEHMVLPHVTKKDRILDFGAGKLAYVQKLAAAGYQIRGLEFYLQRDGKIAHGEVHRHIDRVLEDLRENGPFGVVVLPLCGLERASEISNDFRTKWLDIRNVFLDACRDSTGNSVRKIKKAQEMEAILEKDSRFVIHVPGFTKKAGDNAEAVFKSWGV